MMSRSAVAAGEVFGFSARTGHVQIPNGAEAQGSLSRSTQRSLFGLWSPASRSQVLSLGSHAGSIPKRLSRSGGPTSRSSVASAYRRDESFVCGQAPTYPCAARGDRPARLARGAERVSDAGTRHFLNNVPGRVRPCEPELGSKMSARRRVLQGRQRRVPRVRIRLPIRTPR
jgi:hypothetical protein